jgi:hypothetical protein
MLRLLRLLKARTGTAAEGGIRLAEHYPTIDDYIGAQPADLQPVLQEIRRRIHEALPGAGEKVSYGMPTITRNGHYVVYFAAWNSTCLCILHLTATKISSGTWLLTCPEKAP